MSDVTNALGLTSNSQSSSQGQSTSVPVNLQNPAYQGLAPGVASALPGFYNGGPNVNNTVSNAIGGPFNINGAPGTGNPLVAPLTSQQTGFLNQLPQLAAGTPQFQAGNASLSPYFQPGFTDPTKNPVTQAMVNASIAPIISAFQQTTVPGIQGQFTAAGQKVGQNPTTAQPGGSSAFDRALTEAQTNLNQTVGQTAAGINITEQNALAGQQQNAAALSNQFSTAMLNNAINALNSSALPELVQQYGINQGIQMYQQRINTMLASLGLSGQISQPVVGNNAQSTFNSQGNNQQGLISAIGGGGGVGSLAAI